MVINVVSHVLETLPEARIHGFYTQECRQHGSRIGFDIVYWDNDPTTSDDDVNVDSKSPKPKRAPLARIGTSRNKNDQTVGKYVVDVASVDRVAVPSIEPSVAPDQEASARTELVIVDEVGKMELLVRV